MSLFGVFKAYPSLPQRLINLKRNESTLLFQELIEDRNNSLRKGIADDLIRSILAEYEHFNKHEEPVIARLAGNYPIFSQSAAGPLIIDTLSHVERIKQSRLKIGV